MPKLGDEKSSFLEVGAFTVTNIESDIQTRLVHDELFLSTKVFCK